MSSDEEEYESSSLEFSEDETETEDEEDELDDLDLEGLMDASGPDLAGQVKVTVNKPGEKLGMSLAPHALGTYVHASQSNDPAKQAAIGKLASKIVPIGPGRGDAAQNALVLG